jgi:hypothetical protein
VGWRSIRIRDAPVLRTRTRAGERLASSSFFVRASGHLGDCLTETTRRSVRPREYREAQNHAVFQNECRAVTSTSTRTSLVRVINSPSTVRTVHTSCGVIFTLLRAYCYVPGTSTVRTALHQYCTKVYIRLFRLFVTGKSLPSRVFHPEHAGAAFIKFCDRVLVSVRDKKHIITPLQLMKKRRSWMGRRGAGDGDAWHE